MRCIVIKNDRILLISAKDDDGNLFWSFPKGNQEPGESDIETALRETEEETGLTVRILSKEPIIVSHPIHNNTGTKYIYLYLATPKTNIITIQEDEIESAEWVSFSKAKKRFKTYYKQAFVECIDIVYHL